MLDRYNRLETPASLALSPQARIETLRVSLSDLDGDPVLPGGSVRCCDVCSLSTVPGGWY